MDPISVMGGTITSSPGSRSSAASAEMNACGSAGTGNRVRDAQCFGEIPLKPFHHRAAVATEAAATQSLITSASSSGPNVRPAPKGSSADRPISLVGPPLSRKLIVHDIGSIELAGRWIVRSFCRGLISGDGDFDGRAAILAGNRGRTMFEDAVNELLMLQLIGLHPDRRQNSLPGPVDWLLLGDYFQCFVLAEPQLAVCIEIEIAGLARDQRAGRAARKSRSCDIPRSPQRRHRAIGQRKSAIVETSLPVFGSRCTCALTEATSAPVIHRMRSILCTAWPRKMPTFSGSDCHGGSDARPPLPGSAPGSCVTLPIAPSRTSR